MTPRNTPMKHFGISCLNSIITSMNFKTSMLENYHINTMDRDALAIWEGDIPPRGPTELSGHESARRRLLANSLGPPAGPLSVATYLCLRLSHHRCISANALGFVAFLGHPHVILLCNLSSPEERAASQALLLYMLVLPYATRRSTNATLHSRLSGENEEASRTETDHKSQLYVLYKSKQEIPDWQHKYKSIVAASTTLPCERESAQIEARIEAKIPNSTNSRLKEHIDCRGTHHLTLTNRVEADLAMPGRERGRHFSNQTTD
ncbi:hypothetical protein HU200_067569 [Digitaria exilis]|uniref:Uncharacterized protein n=1 Tax=Digitaria exilis TaxID=1010633 RepID=A0A835DSQ3_9POAL|nr:hypothetical protein HU200_067569 [Digitaria exilis]